MMIVERATLQDKERINDLLYQVNLVHYQGRSDLFKLGKKYTDEQLIEIIQDDQRPILVARDELGIVQGYAFCILMRHENDQLLTDIQTLYIDDLCVDEKIRHKHIGTMLYQAVLDLAKKLNCYNVTLNVWSLNEDAMKFYQACGLVPQKITMEKII